MGAKNKEYDFIGYATRNDIRCTDGRIIRQDAFKHNDGNRVPLVWNHQHDEITNVLGYGILKNENDGVTVQGYLNNTPNGQYAREALLHGDLTGLSIYANHLRQDGPNVVHGDIKEVSIVISPANVGAYIQDVIAHSDDEEGYSAIIYNEGDIVCHFDEDDDEIEEDEDDSLEHSDEEEYDADETVEHADEDDEDDEETVEDVFNTLSEKQKKAVYFMLDKAKNKDTAQHSDEEEDEAMKHNVFDNDNRQANVLSHSDMQQIFADAKRLGSLKDAVEQHLENGVLAHAVTNADGSTQTYGIADIDYLFPDAKTLNNTPEFIKRETDWVSKVMNGTHHTPFSRVKSVFANITMDEARARGYLKGNLKKEEVFSLLKRSTDPQTVYKKQKLDRDDIIDITDFDVVAWLKGEMRMMLEEELARAILVGDGRLTSDDDHISEDHIRPIWTDAELYTVPVSVTKGATDDVTAKNFINTAIKGRKKYKGTGNPTLFTTEDMLTDMLLLEDGVGRKIYSSATELATTLRVKEIVTVPVMEGLSRGEGSDKKDLLGIIVNLADYNVGADKGGETNMFDDFDIDYNQYKYLIETRISGALIKPYAALVLEGVQAAG